MEKKNYSHTLNLPQTNFSMKANLVQKESKLIEFWKNNKVYEKSLNREKDFHFHDGPPYANGEIHIGTALNKILKDIILKYKRLRGYKAKFIPGWDTHGLPIELAVIKKEANKELDEITLREKCTKYALEQVEKQKADFTNIGVLADWDNAYLTLSNDFIAKQLEAFSILIKKGYVYYGLKPVYWSVGCQTALAEAEIEYKDKDSISIYVKFEVKNVDKKTSFVIWTTTPWTLPANVAVAVNSEFNYSFIEANNEILIIASDLVENFLKEINVLEYKEVKVVKGKELEGLKLQHPLLDKESLVILGDHVTLEATGCVHTAPGHGQDDFIIGKKYNLEVICPIDEKGYFNEGKFKGLFYEEANHKIIEELKDKNLLLKIKKITHSYPYCWRSKTPIIFRATRQCFIDIEKSGLRERCLENLKSINFKPDWSINRIGSMIENRPDWCVSRQRKWGVPIPVIFNKQNNEPLVREDIALIISNFVKDKGLINYLNTDLKEILKEVKDIKVEEYEKGKDIMDVWFDSGTVYYSAYNNSTADFYLEGSDQHRGWFQTSLITSVAINDKAPYNALITHGFVVDAHGNKMSKSLGNVISPQEIINEYGADILRLWVSSVDYTSDVRISKEILNQVVDSYRKIRNTLRFTIGNIYDFNTSEDYVKYDKLLEIDKLALYRLEHLKRLVINSYDKYETESVYYKIINFLSTEMSSFYFDILKDRLYTAGKDSIERKSAQTVLYEILIELTKLLAPILSFTSEEIWQTLNEKGYVTGSVFESEIKDFEEKDKEEDWLLINKIRDNVNKFIEKARNEKIINSSLEALVKISINETALNKLKKYSLEEIFIVSKVELLKDDQDLGEVEEGIKIKVEKFNAHKCSRCWKYYEALANKEEELCERCFQIIEKQI